MNSTHIDVGYSRQYAYVLGVRPSVLILCGAADGDAIRDSRTAIKATGGWPAACDCAACKAIAHLMFTQDLTPTRARTIYKRRKAQD